MSLEIAPLIKASGADRALVRRLLHVQDLVNGQGPALAESLAAFGALERLLLAVDVPAEGVFSISTLRPLLQSPPSARGFYVSPRSNVADVII